MKRLYHQSNLSYSDDTENNRSFNSIESTSDLAPNHQTNLSI